MMEPSFESENSKDGNPMPLNRYNGMKRGVALLPNLLTTANLFCGFFSIVQTLNGKFIFAVWLIILASLFDFLDGRVARMTGTQSDFGVEYDSLSDLTTFCMAPGLLIYKWGLMSFGKFGIAAAFLYFCCGALRLARFNVQAGGVEKNDFQGLPTPAAAGTMVSYVLFHTFFFSSPKNYNVFLLTLIVCVALLMVSDIRYRSMKKVNKRISFFTMVCTVAALFLIVSKPEVTLFLVGVLYISVGLIGRVLDFFKKIRYDDSDGRAFQAAMGHPHHDHRGDKPFRKRFRKRNRHRRHHDHHNPQQNQPQPTVQESKPEPQPHDGRNPDNIYKFMKKD
jgi:CDP-diacylglycerol--serine O-phosphatidyltransferase